MEDVRRCTGGGIELSKHLASELLRIGAVKIVGPDHLFTWVSGIKSPVYCDNRMTISYPEIRKAIYKGFAGMIRAKFPEVQVIAGTATAGIPHAAWVAEELGLPMVYVRSASKDHGTQKLVEGVMPEGGKVVLIEDLLSTGKSSAAAVRAIRNEGGDVLACTAIFSYGFPAVAQVFEDLGVPVYALTQYGAVLELALEKGYIPAEHKDTLLQWSENPRMFTDL